MPGVRLGPVLVGHPACAATRVVPPVAGTRVPKVSLQVPGLVVAMRNQAVVAAPLGFADPFKVMAMPVAPSVLTVGGLAGVVNDISEPRPVP